MKRQRMIGRNRQKGSTKKRIRPGCENLNLAQIISQFGFIGHREPQPCALRPANPVMLHQANAFRPAIQPFKRGQQILGKRRDAQKPL
ncbi:MAG: Uncharacterised protein [SAR116 cluster bacterium MED-G04]|nr:MAG: Uncharacterised protein [SAR116 cluster bacterium MED-G04]